MDITASASPELVQACQDYSSYLDFSQLKANRSKQIEQTVEKLLTHGDEVIAVSQTIENDISRFQEEALPVLKERALNLKKAFLMIDRLQELVAQTTKTINIMEIRIEAEEESLKPISILKVLTALSFVSQEELDTVYDKAKAKETTIVNTKEFFEKLKEDLQAISKSINNEPTTQP